MSSSSLVSLHPVDGGDSINIPVEKTVIGRGSLLKITDKRVSRNHATLEVAQGKLIIVPIHTNPCFYKANGSAASVVLVKDKPQPLDHGDIISLLPDKLFFKIQYTNNGYNDVTMEESKTKDGNSAGEQEVNNDEKEEQPLSKPSPKVNDASNQDTPCSQQTRHLPDWMIGAAERLKTQDKVHNHNSNKNNANNNDISSKPKTTVHKKGKQVDYCDDDGDDDDEKDEDNNNDDEDDDYEDEKPIKRHVKKPQANRLRKPPTRRRAGSDDDDDDGKRRKRIPRAATQKVPKYS